MERRGVLRAAALGAMLSATTGCSRIAADVLGRRRAVSVAVTWSGAELSAFHAVLDHLPGSRDNDFAVQPISLGDTDLAMSSREGERPDIVLLSRLGAAIDHCGELEVIPARLRAAFDAPLWRVLLPEHIRPYVMPFKLAFKSAIWFDTRVVDPDDPPRTWGGWLELIGRLRDAHRRGRGPAPLALAASDAWTLTDLFEHILLGLNKQVYAELRRRQNRWDSEEVVRALELLGRLWTPRGTFSGGLRRARVLQFPDAVQDVFLRRTAAMVVAPDFASSFLPPGASADWVLCPVPDESTNPLPTAVLAGDLAALPRIHGWAGASNPMHLPPPVLLLEQLAHQNAPLPWINGLGGFLAANPNVPREHYPPLHRRFYETTFSSAGELEFAFDLSDVATTVGGTEGLWRQLQLFLDAVGERDLSPTRIRQHARDVAWSLAELHRWHQRDTARAGGPTRPGCRP